MQNLKSSKKARKRERLILALLQHPGLEKAASAAGLSISTAWRLRKSPEFIKEYMEARRELVFQAFARIQQAANGAASTLIRIMLDQKAPAAARVRAAAQVLDFGNDSFEREDLERRIADLEQQAAKLGGTK